jgi:MoaA/NifB/PqqE/SkfB family radical SAM enzyme
MKNPKTIIFNEMVNQVISSKVLRGMAAKQLDKYLYNSVMNMGRERLAQEKMDTFHFMSSVVEQVKVNLDKGFIKPDVMKKMAKVFVGDSFTPDRHKQGNPVKEAYKERNGDYPPMFLVLSPGKGCNLHCTGCYASANSVNAEKLDFETSRRIIREAHDIFGSRFMTISGGEPFLYKADGKTLFDLFEEFKDMFFLVYTNGTLITREVADKLADLGNVTPAISVEGWEEQTDQRRGKGVYKHILKAMENLRAAGVPFGISLTATSQNAEILLKDDFYEYFFNELGVSYMWQFQLMPIGRGKDVTELMITPEQRVNLYKQWAHLLEDKHFPIADFWNSGTLSNGCIAYGRWNGYFYIDWNGSVMPCVFVPYSVNNIKDLYSNGKTLEDALQSKMFKNGRKWQKEYGFENPEHRENVLMPCSIRDHYDNFKHNILTPDAKGEDEEAEAVLHDPEYEKLMEDFDEKLQKLTSGIFQEKYLKKDH